MTTSYGETKESLKQRMKDFIELVRFRAETDVILHRHLKDAPKNARYTSKTIQNEIISIISNRICSDILNEVKRAKFFSVIADIANIEQLSICLRYVFDDSVKEVFIDLVQIRSVH